MTIAEAIGAIIVDPAGEGAERMSLTITGDWFAGEPATTSSSDFPIDAAEEEAIGVFGYDVAAWFIRWQREAQAKLDVRQASQGRSAQLNRVSPTDAH